MPKRTGAFRQSKSSGMAGEVSSFILQMAHDAIVVIDEDQKIVFFNYGAEKIFGYNASEVVGREMEILLPPLVADLHRDYVRGLSKIPDNARLMGERREISGRRKDGTIFPAEASIAEISSGKKIFFAAILRDVTERKQADRDLRRREVSYRTILDGIDEIVYQVSQSPENPYEGVVEYVSERTLEVLGYKPNEFIANPKLWFSLIHPMDLPALQAKTEKIFRTGLPGLREYRIKDVNGNYHWLEDRVSPEKDRAGVVKITGVARDITERRQAEETSRLQDLRFRALIDNSSDGIALLDEKGIVAYSSPSFFRILGIRADEFVGRNPFELLHPEDLDQALEKFANLLAVRSRKETACVRVRHQDGRWLWVEATGMNMLDVPGVRGIVVNFRDVTERQLAEEALRQSEEKFRTLFEQASDGIFISDQDGNYLDVNSAGCALLGYCREDLVQMNIRDLVSEDDLARNPLRLNELFSGRTVQSERWMKRKDNSLVLVELSARMLLDGRLQAIVRDISERRRAEAERLQLQSVLEASLNEIYIFDAESLRFQYVNQGALQNLGYSRDAMSQMTPLDLKPEFNLESFRELTQPLLHGGKDNLVFNTVHRRADGSQYPVEVHLQSGEFEGRRVFHAIILDITERRQSEQEALKLRNAVEQSADIIFVTDRSGRIEYVNPGFETITGYRREEAVGRSPSILSSGMMGEEVYEKLWTTIQAGSVYRNEVADRKKNGEIFYYDQTISPIKDERGNITHFVSTGKDVTQARRRMEELETLLKISRIVTQSSALESLLQNILDSIVSVLPAADKGTILLADEAGNLHIQAMSGYTDSRILEVSFPSTWGYSSRAIRLHEPIIFADVQAEEEIRYGGEIEEIAMVKSAMVAPLIAQGRVIGVISMDNVSRTNAFTQEDLRLLVTISSSAALAIQKERLLEETRQRLERIQALYEIDRVIANNVSLPLILDTVAAKAVSQLGADAAAVFLFQADTLKPEVAAGRGFRMGTEQAGRIPLGGHFVGHSGVGQRVIKVLNFETAREIPGFAEFWLKEELTAYFAAPLFVRGQVKGEIEVAYRSPILHTAGGREWLSFLEALAGQAAVAVDNIQLFEDLQRANLELLLAYEATIEGWSQAMDMRDKETEGHTRRVTDMTVRLARGMNIGEVEIAHMRRGALLHDIGKMGVPDGILLKKDKLSDTEWAIMRKHPQFAYDMLAPIAYLKAALEIPYCHHEKWDGSGYPRGLRGEQIPLAARIFALADVYDALTSDRPYRAAWSMEKTLEYIREQNGKHFDPSLVEVFLSVVEKFEDPSP